ncbi:MAG TPA: DNA topoisomerase III [Bacillota bacterium]|nr:DNA topoisomerase III [Bacillota bacterium]
MSKTLVIAEKPSVGRDLAGVLGKLSGKDGYLENDRYIVTWAIGHLVELAPPEDYDISLKSWKLESLPIIPQEFRLLTQPKTAKQFRVVQKLLHHPDVFQVVNACDAGREGELIFHYIYTLSKATLPVKRLWISSLTQEAIKQGFEVLRDGAELRALREAALCRSESDWLVGMNATRGLTQKCGTLLSVGRVQTPTLAMLVRREEEIVNFVPQPYWQVEGVFQELTGKAEPASYKGIRVKGKEDRFTSEEQARAVAEKVAGKEGQVHKLVEKDTKQPPPLLFDLTELQREMNKRFGFPASKTLKVAQSLYETRKLITYPRTDSRYISKDMVPGLRKILLQAAQGQYRPLALPLVEADKLPITGRIVNDAKVSDHHAIIPTPKTANLGVLSPDETKVYDAVLRRFIAVFYPAAQLKNTEVITLVEGETFQTKTKVLVAPGWRSVYGQQPEEDESGDFPVLQEGQKVLTSKAEVLTKETQPPKRFTEASLLSAMETAGKLVEDEELKEAMKESGLGTPATRAATIERLISVGYVVREKKNLVPTAKGKDLINVIPVAELASPQLTGGWEKKLGDIQRGSFTRTTFMQEIEEFIRSMVASIKGMPFTRVSVAPEKSEGKPAGKPAGKSSAKSAAKSAAKSVGKSTGKSTGKTSESKSGSAKSQSGKTLAAETPDNPPEYGTCPLCGGQIIQGHRGYGCANWRQGCKFVIWKEVAGKTLTGQQIQALLAKGRTPLLKGFTSKQGRKFDACLVLADGQVKFEFSQKNS